MVRALALGVYPAGTTMVILLNSCLAWLLLGVLGPFLVFHLWLLSHNMTTIEFCGRRSDGWDEDEHISPYDLGLMENFRAVLGPCVWLWLVPVGGPEGDGFSFACKARPRGAANHGQEELASGLARTAGMRLAAGEAGKSPKPMPELGPAARERQRPIVPVPF